MTTQLKPSLTLCVQNKIGGVQFFYENLVRTGAFDEFAVHYLVLDEKEDPETKLRAPLVGAPTKLFRHSRRENGYCSLRRLSRELPAQPGIVLTNWNFELACLDIYRQPHLTIAHVCHDNYYLDIAVDHSPIIDVFIAHNPYFAEELRARLPTRAADVHFLPFGIRQALSVHRVPNKNRLLRVVYIGRLARIKGVLELPKIDDRLRSIGVKVQWCVLGSGPEKEVLESAIAGRDNFMLRSPANNEEMLRLAAEGDVFVLPSSLDGTPLAVMEAMSVGLVPVVSPFNSGAHWMVPPEVGFVCPVDPEAVATVLARLDTNRKELEERSRSALIHAKANFEVKTKAHIYAEFFARWLEMKRPTSEPPKQYGNRLDQPWLPNPLVMALRQLRR